MTAMPAPSAPPTTAAVPVGSAPAVSEVGGNDPGGNGAATSGALLPAASASIAVAPGAPPAVTPPLLLDAAGSPLPQTDARPPLDGSWFRDLGPALFRAIVADDADLALPHFFPVVAYEQVKAIARPARDWETRLVRLFRRDIHQYHLSLGKPQEQMRYEGLEVPEDRAKYMKPGSEGNRLGYWRVLRSRLTYRDEADRQRSLEVTSLISWRGEWYVVHLHGFE